MGVERAGERRSIKLTPAVVTAERSGLIAAVVAGAGLMRLGCFEPDLVASGRLVPVLTDWSCLGGFNVYAMFRKSSRMPPKVTAFLDFVADAFEAFDPDEVTLLHDPTTCRRFASMPNSRH
jgi:DNA-binding transcriptional LysR family regulator